MSTETATPEEIARQGQALYDRATRPGWAPSIREAFSRKAEALLDALELYAGLEDESIHYSSEWDDLRNERAWPEPLTEALRRAAEIITARMQELTGAFPVLKAGGDEEAKAA